MSSRLTAGGLKRLHDDGAGPSAAPAAPAELPSPICLELLGEPSRAALRAAYEASSPYRHGVLHPLCQDARLRGCFEEMQTHLSGTFKETDLFKVYQTGDLGAMDAADARIPELLSLRSALYSQEFRDFVREVTGCGPLSDRVDCSCNLYTRGGHLLCHDDVIGTRRVSYIVYLAEPEEGWTAEDGGALELFPLAVPGCPGEPAIAPSKGLLPLWNSMALFTVQPGVSFHAVQEVFNDRKLRLSISGWYHAADAPQDMPLASLSQLQARGSDDVGAGAFAPISGLPAPADGASCSDALAPPELSAAEQALLASWVSPEYLEAGAQAGVARQFLRNSSVQLRAFLLPCRAQQIALAAAQADAVDALGGGRAPGSYAAGETAGWAAVGPPHKQRFLAFTPPTATATFTAAASPGPHAACGAALHSLRRDLLASPAFAKLLWRLTALRCTACRSLARRFRPGLDYTVAHYGVLTGERSLLDASIAFVDDSSEEKAALWDSGDCGAFECYLQAEQSADGEPLPAADVYKAREEEEGGEEDDLLSISAAANTLSLVHRHVLYLSSVCLSVCCRYRCWAAPAFPGGPRLVRSARAIWEEASPTPAAPTRGALGTKFRTHSLWWDF